jgi:tetratricopeptide (TPR) repeat protein
VIEMLLAAENALALGLLDQAERTYRQVLDADPRNGIAAVGLSRVALERGDDAGALELARVALDLDPENATARRMVDRLEEVARYRAAAGPGGPTADEVPAPDARPDAPEPTPDVVTPVPTPDALAAPAPARPGLLRRLLGRP